MDVEGYLAFVVHKHRATRLHYDFRLEVGGVMPSWAIPKGPTLDSSVRRLAMPTGDHSLEYRHFEGSIQAGEYGAGAVMIWDEGKYTPEREVEKGARVEANSLEEAKKAAQEGLAAGMMKFRLYGTKLKGSFAIFRTKGLGGKDSWLMVKHRDAYTVPGYDANKFDFSAVSGHSIDQIASKAGNDAGPSPVLS